MIWRDLLLGDLLTLQRGFDITKAQQSAGPFPVVSSSGVNSYHSEFKCNGPGVVIGRKGTLGTAFFLEGAYWPHDTSLWVKDFKGNDPRFCYYLLKSLGLEKYDVGSSNPTLNRNHLHLLPARAPWPDVQSRIADILSAYDDLIENNTRRITILKDMARRLFEEWFGSSNAEAWPEGRLRDVAEPVGKSIAPMREGATTFAHFSLPAFDGGIRPVIESGASILSNKIKIEEPAILLSKLNPRIPRVWPVVALPDEPSVCSTEFLPLKAREGFNYAWVLDLVRSSTFQGMMRSAVGGTSTSHQRVRPEVVLDMPVRLPPSDLIQSYATVATPLVELASSLIEASANLRAARDLLLPKLISGEIEVRSAEEELEAAAA